MRMICMLAVAALLTTAMPGQQGAQAGSSPPTNAAYDAATGDKFRMASIIGIGDIVIGKDFLTTSDGQKIPIRKFADGIYAFPEPPSKLTNGQDFCFSKPVTGFTWHKHNDGLWVMNVGDWRDPPLVPAADTWQADGGCGLFTYKPDGE